MIQNTNGAQAVCASEPWILLPDGGAVPSSIAGPPALPSARELPLETLANAVRERQPLRIAAALAGIGFQVFPLRRGTKDGFLNAASNHGATSDPFAIHAAFAGKDHNVGIWLSDQFVAIDPDLYKPGVPEAWAALCAEVEEFPKTFTTKSARGGRHFIFRTDNERFSNSPLAPGIDVKACNAYVLAPGSWFKDEQGRGGFYEFEVAALAAALPEELRSSLRRSSARGTEGPRVVGELDENTSIVAAVEMLKRAAPAIEGKAGDWHTFVVACSVIDLGISEGKTVQLMAEHWNPRCQPPWDIAGDKSLSTKVGNAWRYRSAEVGRDNPRHGFEPLSPEEIAGTTVAPTAKAPDEFARRLAEFTQTAATEAKIQVRRWIADRRLLRGYITGVIAPGGVGKSALSLQWAAAIVLGNGEFCGLDVRERTNVLVINNEDPQSELDLRTHAIFKHFKLPFEGAHGRLIFYSGYGGALRMAMRSGRGAIEQGPLINELIRTIKDRNIGVVVVDPLVSTFEGLSENDNPDMDALMGIYRKVAAETDAAILVLHHTRKPPQASSESYVGSIEAGRGATSLKDAWRLGLTLFNISEEDAKKLGVPPAIRHRYLRLDETEKFNVGIRETKPQLFERTTVLLTNSSGQSEAMGVLVPAFRRNDSLADVETLMRKAIREGLALSPKGQSPTSAAAWLVRQQPGYEEYTEAEFTGAKANCQGALDVLVGLSTLEIVDHYNKSHLGQKYAIKSDAAKLDTTSESSEELSPSESPESSREFPPNYRRP